jgi:3-oxoadipate enol-lactonase
MPKADLNGIRMNYRVSGSGVPLVLLTGFGGTAGYWDSVVPELEGRFTVITLDNRGSGETESKGPFTVEDMAEDVSELLDSLSLDGAHVLGWSMGSQIAQALAINHPDKVYTLALVSSYLKRPDRSSYLIGGMLEAVKHGMPMRFFKIPMKAMGHTERYFEGRKFTDERDSSHSVDGLARQIAAVDAYSTEDSAHMIMCPTLSIHGSEDIMVPQEFGDALADRIRDCTIIRLRGEGHNIRPSKYIESYASFAISHGR